MVIAGAGTTKFSFLDEKSSSINSSTQVEDCKTQTIVVFCSKTLCYSAYIDLTDSLQREDQKEYLRKIAEG